MTGQVLPEKVRKGDPKRDRGNRTGFSTGANSAAAAAAATLGLVHGRVPDFVDCVLPNTQRVRFITLQGKGAPLAQWQTETRDVAADFAKLFADELPAGSSVPKVRAVLVGADSDNTGSQSVGWVQALGWVK